jgi:hypothetical protein
MQWPLTRTNLVTRSDSFCDKRAKLIESVASRSERDPGSLCLESMTKESFSYRCLWPEQGPNRDRATWSFWPSGRAPYPAWPTRRAGPGAATRADAPEEGSRTGKTPAWRPLNEENGSSRTAIRAEPLVAGSRMRVSPSPVDRRSSPVLGPARPRRGAEWSLAGSLEREEDSTRPVVPPVTSGATPAQCVEA